MATVNKSNITIIWAPQSRTKNLWWLSLSFDKFFGQYDLQRDGMDWVLAGEIIPTKSDIQAIKQSKIDYQNDDFITLDNFKLWCIK